MFDSGISAKDLVAQLKDEADVAVPISNLSYIQWLNSLEQLIYTEIIQEQGKIEVKSGSRPYIEIDTLTVPSGESSIRFEDVYAVYVDFGIHYDVMPQLIKSTLASGNVFYNVYYKDGNNIGYRLKEPPNGFTIIYIVRPALKTVTSNDVIDSGNVMLPVEFIDLAKAKLRGEAYKLANEDALAAKWLNDYNVLLENFKTWMAAKQSNFGM